MTPAPRTLRKRKVQKEIASEDELFRPLTEEERLTWEGWAEIESEPALFNYILKGQGVKDIKMMEITSIDDDSFNNLPHPVHGIIFLFKYREVEDVTAALPKCPRSIWFANQIADNSCASIAMLNILMNSQDVDLGPTLSAFKASTMNKKPPWRGLHLKNHAAIRAVHNSFVRRVEVLNSDLYLQKDFEKWVKTAKSQASTKKRKVTPAKKTAKQLKDADDDAAFHYIAYVPIDGEVWRMDGMQKNPVNLGAYKNDWLSLARENVMIQMAMHPSEIMYNFLAMCSSPLSTIRSSLAANTHAIQLISSQLDIITPDWRSFFSENAPSPSKPRELQDSYNLDPATILAASIEPMVTHKLAILRTDTEGLIHLRENLIKEEKRLQRAHCEEVLDDSEQAEKAETHRVDYGPAVYKLVKGMLDTGELEEVWDGL